MPWQETLPHRCQQSTDRVGTRRGKGVTRSSPAQDTEEMGWALRPATGVWWAGDRGANHRPPGRAGSWRGLLPQGWDPALGRWPPPSSTGTNVSRASICDQCQHNATPNSPHSHTGGPGSPPPPKTMRDGTPADRLGSHPPREGALQPCQPRLPKPAFAGKLSWDTPTYTGKLTQPTVTTLGPLP